MRKGSFYTTRENSSIFRLLPLLPLFLLLMAGACNKDEEGNGSKDQIPQEQGVQAMIQVLKKHQLLGKFKSAAGPSLEDYIESEYAEDGDLEMRLQLAQNGELLPSSTWRQNNPDYCARQDQYFRSPRKWLTLTVHRFSDGYIAFARYIDVETGKVEEMREGESTELQDALDKAFQALQNSPVNAAASPCGEERDLRLVFRAQTSFSSPSGALDQSDAVLAEIPLRNIGNSFRLEGSAPLSWESYSVTSSAVSYNCAAPADARVKVTELRTGSAELPVDSLRLRIQFKDWSQSPCTITVNGNTVNDSLTPGFANIWQTLHVNDTYQTIIRDPRRGVLTNESIYQFGQWESVPDDPLVVGRLQWSKSLNQGGAQYTEETTITLRQ
jgi:hypothetical protein